MSVSDAKELRFGNPLAAAMLPPSSFVRYTGDTLSDRTLRGIRKDRIVGVPPGRVYGRFPRFAPKDAAEFFDKQMATDRLYQLSTRELEEAPGLNDNGRTARYLPLVFAETDLVSPAGFAAMNISLATPDDNGIFGDDDGSVFVEAEPRMMYVRPEYRGLGFGLMLTHYTCSVICAQFEHLARQWSGGPLKVTSNLYADFESLGGERAFWNIFAGVESWVRRERRKIRKETKVEIAMPEADAGY